MSTTISGVTGVALANLVPAQPVSDTDAVPISQVISGGTASRRATLSMVSSYVRAALQPADITHALGYTPLSSSGVSVALDGSGAKLDGSTDDVATINAFLALLAPGTTAIMPGGKFALISSANLVVPAGITIQGGNPFSMWGSTAGPFAGSGFLLDPARTILLTQGASLRGLKIYRSGLAAAPSVAQVNAAVTQWGNDAVYAATSSATAPNANVLTFASTTSVSVGQKVFGSQIQAGTTVTALTSTTVTLSLVVGAAGIYSGQTIRFGSSVGVTLLDNGTGGPSGGNKLCELMIVGFNTGIQAGCGDYVIEDVWIDCWHGIDSVDAGDQCFIYRTRCEPWYGLNNGSSCWARPGIGFWMGPGSTGHNLTDCFAFCWKTGYLLDGTSNAGLSGCCCEDGANQSGGRGFVVQNHAELTSVNGGSIGFLDTCVDVQNPTAGAAPVARFINLYTLPNVAADSHYRFGAATQGRVAFPQVNANGVKAFHVQASVGGPVYLESPEPWAGSPTIEAVIDPTSVSAVFWSGFSIGNAFKLSPVTNDANGGNARGSDSVDLQVARTAATQVASGARAAILGGDSNTASANWSVAGGKQNTVSGQSGTAFGFNNQITGQYSAAPGGASAADRGRTGCLVFSSNSVAAAGTQQTSLVNLGAQTTSATPAQLTVDRSAAGAANVCNIPNGVAYSIDIRVIGKASNGQATWTSDGLLLIGAASPGGVLLIGGGTLTLKNSNGTVTGWAVSVAADTTNGGVNVTVTGAAGQTIDWTATLLVTEVS